MKRIIQREGETSRSRRPGKSARGCQVLVADDNDFMRHCVRLLLLREGCEVADAVGDGKDLVSSSQLHEHDLIVTDLHMPGLDGLQAARAILARQPDSRIIVLTSDDDYEAARTAFAAGVLAYVLKDRMISDLPLAVSAAMAGKSFLSPSIIRHDYATSRPSAGPLLAGIDFTTL